MEKDKGFRPHTFKGEPVKAARIAGWRLVLGLDDGSNVHVGSNLHGGEGGPEVGDVLVETADGQHIIVPAAEWDGEPRPEEAVHADAGAPAE